MRDSAKFIPLEEELDQEELSPAQAGYLKSSLRLFLKNRLGLAALIVLVIIVMLCLGGEKLRPYGVSQQQTAIKNQPPSKEHWFGTDQLGRDIFVRVCHGGRVLIEIGITAALIVSFLGVVYGSVSGYAGGKTDLIMMRIVEVFKGVPHLVIVILLSIILGVKGIVPLIIALTVSGWVNTAQVIRGQVLKLKNQEFILAARCLGVSGGKMITRHLLPNMTGMIIVTLTLDIPAFIFEEAFLSFIGLGLKNPSVSWGILISLAQPNLVHYPYQTAFPALAISITMVALNIFGNALKDAFDPKLRK